MINSDGSGFRELTSGPNNNGFPSMSPDGHRFVYRTLVQKAMVFASWTSTRRR
jgi:Tol biopolymer transport system component